MFLRIVDEMPRYNRSVSVKLLKERLIVIGYWDWDVLMFLGIFQRTVRSHNEICLHPLASFEYSHYRLLGLDDRKHWTAKPQADSSFHGSIVKDSLQIGPVEGPQSGVPHGLA